MNLAEILKVIFLGAVQGVTEWLPISSTGHMILIDEFLVLDASPEFKEMFFVWIQLGSIFAVAVIFWESLFPFSFKRDGNKFAVKPGVVMMWLKILTASLPAAVIGLMFNDWIDGVFYNPYSIAASLITYGVLFIAVEKSSAGKSSRIGSQTDFSFRTAFFVGVFQMLALVPGTSRSGATIIGAMLLGASRTAAAQFSFFLAIPAMFGASLVKVLKFGTDFSKSELSALILGMAAAFCVSMLVIKFLMDFVKNKSFAVFGWYRIALGAAVTGYYIFLR